MKRHTDLLTPRRHAPAWGMERIGDLDDISIPFEPTQVVIRNDAVRSISAALGGDYGVSVSALPRDMLAHRIRLDDSYHDFMPLGEHVESALFNAASGAEWASSIESCRSIAFAAGGAVNARWEGCPIDLAFPMKGVDDIVLDLFMSRRIPPGSCSETRNHASYYELDNHVLDALGEVKT